MQAIIEKYKNLAVISGSTSTTTKGALQFLLNRKITLESAHRKNQKIANGKRGHIQQKWSLNYALRRSKKTDVMHLSVLPMHFSGCNIQDDSIRDLSVRSAQKNNPRKKNLYTGAASALGAVYQERTKIIRYRGKYRYTGSEIYANYQSGLFFSKSGKCAWLIQGCKVIRKLIAPTGMRWKKDNHGALLSRVSDGMDYHPTLDDLRSCKFCTLVRGAMSKNWKLRQEAVKKSKEFARLIPTTRVLLEDSQRAGNCVQGTLQFAEMRLKISREMICGAIHLIGVSAKKLILISETHPQEKEKIMGAINCAIARETLVSI